MPTRERIAAGWACLVLAAPVLPAVPAGQRPPARPPAKAPAKAAAAPRAAAPAGPDVRLPWRVVRLENGLTLLMQPDPSLPDVGVEVFIRGGSREEPPGRFGVAHLFEHEVSYANKFLANAANRAAFRQASRGGGAGAEQDFLRFHTQVTPEGLELAVAALADRLQPDMERYTDERLRKDQDIVISELRRGMGVAWDTEVRARLHRGTFGAGHPYGHSTGGSEADVRAATVETIREWHRTFAGASNAFVLMSGDFDPGAAEAMVRRHFGPLEPGRPAPRATEWVPRAAPLREVIEREFPAGTVFLSWPVPGWGTPDGDALGLLARVLERRVARVADASAGLDDASAGVELWDLAGAFTLRGSFADAAGAAAAEGLLRAELARLLGEGPTAAELALARAQHQAEFVRSLQRAAWRGGRTDVLGQGLLFRGDPDAYRAQLARVAAATPALVRDAGRRWLAEPAYTLHVLPQPARRAAGAVDRSAAVAAPAPKPAAFPAVEDVRLANGLRLLVARRPQLPLVQLTVALEAGSASDSPASPGLARAALEALAGAPAGPGGEALGDALAALGATLETELDADYATLSVSVLSDRAGEAVRLLGAALSREAPAAAAEAAAARAAERDAAARKDPLRARDRLADCMASGAPCAPEGAPGRVTVDDVRRFAAAHYRPERAVVVASGDVTRERLAEWLGRALAGWAPRGEAAPPQAAGPSLPRTGGAAVVVYPGATQAFLVLEQRLPAEVAADPLLAELVTMALRTRLMDNLRTDKGWSYEVYPFGVDVSGGGAVVRFNVPLKTEKTAEAIAEIRAEVARLRGQPLSADALAAAKNYAETSRITGALTSLEEMNARLLDLARAGRPAGYYADALRRLAAFTAEDVARAARELLDPDRMVWVVAGDRAAAERELREAGFGDVRVVTPGT